MPERGISKAVSLGGGTEKQRREEPGQGFSVPAHPPSSSSSCPCTFEMRPQDGQNVKHDLGGRHKRMTCVLTAERRVDIILPRGGDGRSRFSRRLSLLIEIEQRNEDL